MGNCFGAENDRGIMLGSGPSVVHNSNEDQREARLKAVEERSKANTARGLRDTNSKMAQQLKEQSLVGPGNYQNNKEGLNTGSMQVNIV